MNPYSCTKELIEDTADTYFRLCVFEREDDGVRTILDIMHFKDEASADAYLRRTYGLAPPAEGEMLDFEADRPS